MDNVTSCDVYECLCCGVPALRRDIFIFRPQLMMKWKGRLMMRLRCDIDLELVARLVKSAAEAHDFGDLGFGVAAHTVHTLQCESRYFTRVFLTDAIFCWL